MVKQPPPGIWGKTKNSHFALRLNQYTVYRTYVSMAEFWARRTLCCNICTRCLVEFLLWKLQIFEYHVLRPCLWNKAFGSSCCELQRILLSLKYSVTPNAAQQLNHGLAVARSVQLKRQHWKVQLWTLWKPYAAKFHWTWIPTWTRIKFASNDRFRPVSFPYRKKSAA